MSFSIKSIVSKLTNNSLFRSAGVYTIANVINAAIPFLLLPVLTRYLTPEDYGIVAMYGVLITFVTPLVGFNSDVAVGRQYYDRDISNMPVYVSSCFLILLCSAFIVFLVFHFLAVPLSQLISIPVEWLWTIVLVTSMLFACRLILILWQVQVMPIRYGAFQTSMTALNAGLSLILVIGFGLAWQGRLLGQIISVSVFFIISVFILIHRGWLTLRVDKESILNALNFGVPLIPHVLGGAIISLTDRFLITKFIGLNATGLYTVGYQVGMILLILVESFNKAYVPWLFERLKLNDSIVKIKLVKFTYLYFTVILVIALCLGFFAPLFLKYFIGKQFSGSARYVVWLALAFSFEGMRAMVVNYIFYSQKTGTLAVITFFSGGCSVILSYVFIKKYGAIGAAQATCIGFFIKFILTWILSSRVYKMPWGFFLNKNYVN